MGFFKKARRPLDARAVISCCVALCVQRTKFRLSFFGEANYPCRTMYCNSSVLLQENQLIHGVVTWQDYGGYHALCTKRLKY